MPAEPIRWETIACPLCGGAEERDFFRTSGDGVECRLAECARCRLVYMNPRPDEASIGQFYPEEYPEYQPQKLRRAGPLRRLRDRLGLKRERTLCDRIPRPAGGVLLDYGCGSGAFAAMMRDRGWDAVGMDFSPHAVAAARRNYGLRVIHGTFPHHAVRPGSVDVVTLRQVLEHVHDPAGLVAESFAVLKPGGWLFVSVPNLASWGFGAFGADWFPLGAPRHLTLFTPPTLRAMVDRGGFETAAVDTPGHNKWMRFSVDLARRHSGRWWLRACGSRVIRSALTRWTAWSKRGDELALLARKPDVAAAELRKAA